MRNRMIRAVALTLGAMVVGLGGLNYVMFQRSVNTVLDEDSRNEGMRVYAHYRYWVDPRVLVYDLRNISDTTRPLDVTRVLLQFAASQKKRSFETVLLAHQGVAKFKITGEYFRELGAEYGSQNPAYTIRTMPENFLNIDGTPAFGRWTGGILGVLTHQMEDVTALHRSWYVDDLNSEKK